MSKKRFTASVSKTQGKSLCLIFRHPVRTDRNGKPGLRIRRGLGTSDQAEADRLVAQMNEILSDEAKWKPSERQKAGKAYDTRIVSAFYDDLQPRSQSGWDLRNRVIVLPGREQGYVRVIFLGTTGAGKTTLLRQILGTDPTKERFPSTSTAKTTTCDIEIVLADGDFKAVVSFLSKELVRQLVADCVSAAIMATVEGRRPAEVARKLLEHREQRFRLSYLLGSFESHSAMEDEDDDFGEDIEDAEPEQTELNQEEKESNRERLLEYLDRINMLSKESSTDLENELEFDPSTASREDRDAFEELFNEHLETITEFQELVDEIMDDCEQRFDLLEVGELHKGSDRWPTSWTIETEDREVFVHAINRFSSNAAFEFGRLLTPFVEGIRVSGPFGPEWLGNNRPRLVLLDGQGLGHTPSSAASISTNITKRFEFADSILLVDSAAQPMQAAPLTVLRSVVASGHESKLAIGFTHFDEVIGDNLPNRAARRDHVLSSLDNAVADVGKSHGRLAETALKTVIADRTFFMENLHEILTDGEKGTKNQLRKLVKVIEASGKPLEASEFHPIYDDANLILLVQQAMEEFRDPWRARLKLPSKSSLPPEHWTRIKALTRHISQLGADEYDSLRPVAEFISKLQSHIARFLAKPVEWDPCEPPTEELINLATASLKQSVFQQLHQFAHSRLIDENTTNWSHAFSAHSGTGSTSWRAKDVEGIYETAAPIPTGVAEENSNKFLIEIRRLVGNAIEEGGGRLTSGLHQHNAPQKDGGSVNAS